MAALRLPIPGSGCDGIRVVASGSDLHVEYQYGERDQTFIGKLTFDWSIAHRFRDEQHSVGFLPNSYDTVIEVEGSTWLKEIGGRDARWRHFAVFFSNIGYVEVLARGFQALPERAGVLQEEGS